MEYDDLELDTLGEKKTALFVIILDTDSTFNFVVSIMYSQLFNLLCDKADDVYNGRLPVHVRMLLDEFANIGQIPQFEKLIATIHSREISVLWDYPKDCVNLQTDVRYNYTVWRYYYGKKKRQPTKGCNETNDA